MSEKSAVGEHEVLVEGGTIAFQNVFEAKPFIRNGRPVGDPVFSITMLYDPEMLKSAKAMAITVAKAKWGSTAGVRFPFLKGEAEAKASVARAKAKGKTNWETAGDFYGDRIVVKAKSKYQVPVYDMTGKEMLAQKDLYSGSVASVLLKFVANGIAEKDPHSGETVEKKYVSAYLQGVKKTGKGERLFGRDLASVFGGTKDDDEALGTAAVDLDDEIPFD